MRTGWREGSSAASSSRTPLFVVLVILLSFRIPATLRYIKVTYRRNPMTTGTSKWVYESTEIIPYKKTDCKRFAVFVPKHCIIAHFRAFCLVFQSLGCICLLLPFLFAHFVSSNRFATILGPNCLLSEACSLDKNLKIWYVQMPFFPFFWGCNNSL